MEQMNALITANFDPRALERLETALELDVEYAPIADRDGRLPDDELRERVRGVEILIVGYEGVSESIIDAAEDLRIIACTRGGPDANVDIEAATERGIPVLYAPGRNAISVADYTWGMILSTVRNIAHSHHLLHTGQYTGRPQADAAAGGQREDVTWGMGAASPYVNLKGPELDGRTVGIIGMGAIGREVATRAQGFGVELLGYDPYIDTDAMAEYDTRKVELETLCRNSDVITVHTPVTENTRGMIDRELFDLMKDTAFFINTARGAIIEQDALVDALRAGTIRGAALDVYDMEPIPDDHPLLDLNTVVTTPHLAGAAEDVITRHSKMLVDDIEALLTNEPPAHVANETVLSRDD